MIDYSLFYIICYSFIMSLGVVVALMLSGMKMRCKPYICFFMLFIPKAICNFCRFYIESYGSNLPMVIILSVFFIFFDFALIFAAFENTFQEKFIIVAFMDIFFMPVLTVKQHFEVRFQENGSTLLFFDNFGQLLFLIFSYTIALAIILVIFYFSAKILKKINFNTKLFDIFGKVALAGYLFIEIASVIGFFENIIVKENNVILYLIVGAIWVFIFISMYIANDHLAKKRLLRELEVLNTEKEREFRYYNLMKNHNEEIRKIKHDLSGHFSVLTALIKNKDYTMLEDYISRLSENYNKIKRVVYTSNIMADAVISSIAEKCEKNEICFECEGTLTDYCNIDDISLTCIFSNILDNAFEACNKVKSDRFIRLSVFCKSDCVVINCINSKSENQKDGFLKTTKSENGHGFGIKIIKEIVSNYDGVVRFEDNGNEFEVSLLIPQKAVAVT